MDLPVLGGGREPGGRGQLARYGAVALVFLAVSPPAHACIWMVAYDLSILGPTPTDGYPVNSSLPVSLSGYDTILAGGSSVSLLPPSFFAASGLPLTLREGLPLDELRYGEIRVADLGEPGATVHLRASDSRATSELTLTVGPPDHTPPRAPRVAFGVHQHPTYPREEDRNSCSWEPAGNIALWVHLSLDADPTSGAPTVFRITVRDHAELLADETILAHGRETVVPIRGLWEGDPDTLRVEVVASDMAGNTAALVSASAGALRRDWGAYGRVDTEEPVWEDTEMLPGGGIPTIAAPVPRPIRHLALPTVGALVLVLLVQLRRGVATVGGRAGIGVWLFATTAAVLWAVWRTGILAHKAPPFTAVTLTLLVLGATPMLRALPAAMTAPATGERFHTGVVAAETGFAGLCSRLRDALTSGRGSPHVWIGAALALFGWSFAPELSHALFGRVGLEAASFPIEHLVWPEVVWMVAVLLPFAVGLRGVSRQAPVDPELARAPIVMALAAICAHVLYAMHLPFGRVLRDDVEPLWVGALCALAVRPWGRRWSVGAGLLGVVLWRLV